MSEQGLPKWFEEMRRLGPDGIEELLAAHRRRNIATFMDAFEAELRRGNDKSTERKP